MERLLKKPDIVLSVKRYKMEKVQLLGPSAGLVVFTTYSKAQANCSMYAFILSGAQHTAQNGADQLLVLAMKFESQLSMLYLVSAEYRGWRLGGVYILKKGLLVCRRAVLSWVTVSYSRQCSSLFQFEKLWPIFILLRLVKLKIFHRNHFTETYYAP